MQFFFRIDSFAKGKTSLAGFLGYSLSLIHILSTYVNALSKAGFIIEEMVEESDEDILSHNEDSEFAKKAKMLPVTFVIKARKL